MEINTQYFGKISCSEDEFIHFSDGLFGFSDLQDYVPLAFQENSDALICLQSLEDSSVSFILMNPFEFFEKYEPELSHEDKAFLKAEGKEDDISYYVISVIHEPMENSTVNLKAPIAVNTKTRQARQIVLDNPLYRFRHPLRDFIKKGD